MTTREIDERIDAALEEGTVGQVSMLVALKQAMAIADVAASLDGITDALKACAVELGAISLRGE